MDSANPFGDEADDDERSTSSLSSTNPFDVVDEDLGTAATPAPAAAAQLARGRTATTDVAAAGAVAVEDGVVAERSAQPATTAQAVSEEDVGRYLVEQDLLLTALEFYQECLENGRAGELDFLRQCFEARAAHWAPSDDAHLDTISSGSSGSARGSTGSARGTPVMGRTSNELSRIMKEKEDKIVLLEYELRLSKDDIQSLKSELKQLRTRQLRQDSAQDVAAFGAVVPGGSQAGPFGGEQPGDDELASKSVKSVDNSPPSEGERRLINHMVKRYLVERGYKLTAITFGEEAEEELDLLEPDTEAGPQSLTALQRHYYHNPAVRQLSAVQAELKEAKESNAKYQERVDALEDRIAKLIEEKEYVEKELDYMRVRTGDKKREGSLTPVQLSLRRSHSTEIHSTSNPTSPRRPMAPVVVPINLAAILSAADGNEAALTAKDEASSDAAGVDGGEVGSNPATASSTPRDLNKEEEAEEVVGEQATSETTADASDDIASASDAAETSNALEEEKEEQQPPQETDAKQAMRRRRSQRLLQNLRKTSIADATRIQREVERIVTVERDNQGAVKIVAECLPHIVPGVLLNTREELIPVILVAIRQHPDTKTRDHLTQMLFNLIKIPDENQRRIIMDGCVALSRIIGQDRTGSELLPQCWEQISSKHKERRVLVAESCGALAPFVQSELRASLILSILVQLLDDKSPLVRAAVARNLGILIYCLDENEANKYQQIQELLFRLLKDGDPSVVQMTQDIFLPMLVDWADTLDLMSSHLLTTLLAQIQNFSEITEVNEHRLAHLDIFLSSFDLVIPRFVESVLLSSPFGAALLSDEEIAANALATSDEATATRDRSNTLRDSLCILSSNQRQYLIDKLGDYLKEHCANGVEQGATWPALEWLSFVYIPKLIDLLVPMIGVSDQSKPHEVLNIMAKGMTNVVVRLCRETGEVFVHYVLRPQFLREIESPESDARRLAALQVFVVGVLPFLGDAKLTEFLRELIISIALEESGWNHSHLALVNDCLELLCKRSEEMRELVLTFLWDLVVHPSTQVRQTLVKMFDHMTTFMEKEKVTKRVLPALLTLGNDIEPSVRAAAIMPIGYVAINIPDNLLLERINVQFETWEQDEGNGVQLELINTFASIIPQVKTAFRDSFMVPKLTRMAEKNNSCTDIPQRQATANALLDALRAFHGSNILFILSLSLVVRDGLVPGLNFLQNDFEVMDPLFKKTITSMLNDTQTTAGVPTTPKKSVELQRDRRDTHASVTPRSGEEGEATSLASSSSSGSSTPAASSSSAGGGEEHDNGPSTAEMTGEATVNKLFNRWKQSSTAFSNIGSSLKAWKVTKDKDNT